MSEINLNINLLNTPTLSPTVNKNNLIAWLKNSGLDDDVLDLVTKEVIKYPPAALRHYCENIHKHIAKAQEEVQKKRSSNSNKT